jgi:hypothetical protein
MQAYRAPGLTWSGRTRAVDDVTAAENTRPAMRFRNLDETVSFRSPVHVLR